MPSCSPLRSAADAAARLAEDYDGVPAQNLVSRLGIPRVVLYAAIGSTQDAAHDEAAEGAPAGTLILADTQTAGRGRAGRSWQSAAGAGVWLTVIERPRDAEALEVLSLRVGLALAQALDGLAGERVSLKWPNDLYVHGRKLGGVLVEARWRDGGREGVPEWIAIGVGINRLAPHSEPRAVGLGAGATRLATLDAGVPAIRRAALMKGPLGDRELEAFSARDMARGRECVAPAAGTVRGIDRTGALLIAVGSETAAVRSGSLVFKEEQ